MATRNQQNTGQQYREHAREQEVSKAQAVAQQQAQANADSPLIDFQDGGAELYDRITDPDLESSRYDGIEDLVKPYLSTTQMLANHDDGEYYDDISHELLNENLADRLIRTRERGRHLTGPFLEVARDVEHEHGEYRSRPLAPSEQEALRAAIENVRTDRQSLGDGEFLESITEMHVSSEVRRDEDVEESSSGSILSSINPF